MQEDEESDSEDSEDGQNNYFHVNFSLESLYSLRMKINFLILTWRFYNAKRL